MPTTLFDHIRPTDGIADLLEAPGDVRLPPQGWDGKYWHAFVDGAPVGEDDWGEESEFYWLERPRPHPRQRHRHARAYVRHQAERALARARRRMREVYQHRGLASDPAFAERWRHALSIDRVRCSCWLCRNEDGAYPPQALRLRDADAADLEELCEVPEPDPLVEHVFGPPDGEFPGDLPIAWWNASGCTFELYRLREAEQCQTPEVAQR